ncbi:nucleotidyltransferase domain-containing protein [Kocuria flava]|uniref:nucleotidyltransferase domain-containing protein n=1 Tax=Kocuria flava TaxID=446860 RepID=UPI00117E4923|nr:nucleotidyltransferase [Kocuria flava]
MESLIRTMTPDEAARTAAAKHRKEIEDWLTSDLGIIRMRETGSWHHGTALDRFSDVDYFVSMRDSRPSVSSTALEDLRASLSRGIQGAFVSIDRPAVRLRYFDDGPDVEITPAYYQDTDDYDIPDPDSAGWIRSNSAVHLEYVDRAQKETDGRAKGLIRLVKTWKSWNNVPLSSFYLEMRTAQYALGNKPIIYDWDLRDIFKSLANNGFREMNDPTNYGRRITTGTSNLAESITAKYAVEEAARLARLAREAAEADDHSTAIRHLLTLFNCEA